MRDHSQYRPFTFYTLPENSVKIAANCIAKNPACTKSGSTPDDGNDHGSSNRRLVEALERHLRSKGLIGKALRVLCQYAYGARVTPGEEDMVLLLALSTAWNRARRPKKA